MKKTIKTICAVVSVAGAVAAYEAARYGVTKYVLPVLKEKIKKKDETIVEIKEKTDTCAAKKTVSAQPGEVIVIPDDSEDETAQPKKADEKKSEKKSEKKFDKKADKKSDKKSDKAPNESDSNNDMAEQTNE